VKALRFGIATALAVVPIALAVACNAPTQVKLVVSTDIPCDRLKGIAITGGPLATVEDSAPQTVTYTCGAGGVIGTLYSTPADADDGKVAFRVLAGVDKDVSQCTERDGYAGCSRQLRQLAYLPHETAELPIVLYLVCVGVPCDRNSTCAITGKCVPPTSECAAGACASKPPVGADGGPILEDGSVGSDGATGKDGATETDSGTDGGSGGDSSTGGDASNLDGAVSDDGGGGDGAISDGAKLEAGGKIE